MEKSKLFPNFTTLKWVVHLVILMQSTALAADFECFRLRYLELVKVFGEDAL